MRTGRASLADKDRESAAIDAFEAFPEDIKREAIARDVGDSQPPTAPTPKPENPAADAIREASDARAKMLQGLQAEAEADDLWRTYKADEHSKEGVEARRAFLRFPPDLRRKIIADHEAETLREEYRGMPASPTDLDERAATQAYRNLSWSAEKRGKADLREYADTYNDFHADMTEFAEEHGIDVTDELAKAKSELKSAYQAMWSAKSGSSSWAITGRGGRNARREQKRGATADRRTADAAGVLPKWRQRIRRMVKREANKDAGAVASAAERELARAEKYQQTMKAANKIVRRKKQDIADKVVELQALGFSEKKARELFEPDFAGRIGFPGYQLTNNNAGIKRLRAKVAKEREREQRQGIEEVTHEFQGSEEFPHAGRVTYDYEADRIYLQFDGRVPKDVFRSIQRGTGFNWSRRESAFSHKMGSTGYRTAKRIAGGDLPAPEKTEQT